MIGNIEKRGGEESGSTNKRTTDRGGRKSREVVKASLNNRKPTAENKALGRDKSDSRVPDRENQGSIYAIGDASFAPPTESQTQSRASNC